MIMYRLMTFIANRNNIQSLRIVRMMVLFCLCTTVIYTLVSGSFWESLSFYGMIQYRSSFIFLCMILSVCFSYSCSFGLKSLCMLVLFIIFVMTLFTPTKSTIIRRFISIKLRNVFFELTFRTSFGYNWFSHSCFLSKRVWLGPAGSTYFPSARSILHHSHLMSRRNSHCR